MPSCLSSWSLACWYWPKLGRVDRLGGVLGEADHLAEVAQADVDLPGLVDDRRRRAARSDRQVLVAEVALGLEVEVQVDRLVGDAGGQAEGAQRLDPLDLERALGVRIGGEQPRDVEVGAHERVARQALEVGVERRLGEVVVALGARERGVEQLVRAGDDQRVVLDREAVAVVLVERRAGLLAALLGAGLLQRVGELAAVLGLDRADEVVRVAFGGEGLGVHGADHERVAEQRLDVVVVGDVPAARLDLLLELLLDLPTERQLVHERGEVLVLAALHVRVDRDDERRVLGQEAEPGLERAARAAAVTAPAAGDRDRDREDGQGQGKT